MRVRYAGDPDVSIHTRWRTFVSPAPGQEFDVPDDFEAPGFDKMDGSSTMPPAPPAPDEVPSSYDHDEVMAAALAEAGAPVSTPAPAPPPPPPPAPAAAEE